MNLAGNYPSHTEASYSQLCCGDLRELSSSVTPPSAVDVPYLGWSSLGSYRLKAPQDIVAQVQDYKDYGVNNNGIKPVKRRVSANKKERRRTLSINNAFQELRECIPNVPSDTKLSKIKTLKLATSYIAYLYDLLSQDESNSASPLGKFNDELYTKLESKDLRRNREMVSYFYLLFILIFSPFLSVFLSQCDTIHICSFKT